MYVKERLGRRRPGRFVEVGVGGGWLSRLLLDLGWRGTGFEPNRAAAATARALAADAVADGRYALHEDDWLETPPAAPSDLIASSMVLEHLDEAGERRYFERSRAELAPGGLGVLLVPGSIKHWGPEDEIAGHYRRYTFESMCATLARVGWRVDHLAGLTFPLSNVLLPVSDFLVARAEGGRTRLDRAARTIASGDRDVLLKTRFPAFLGLVLNERVMYPFHLWQKANITNERSLVLYVECLPGQ